MRALLVAAAVLLAASGCWPEVPDGWEPDRGEAITRVRAVEGDAFLKLKDGLARTLYEQLDGDERCVDGVHCRRRGTQIICSTENLRDPYVCELHLRDGVWVAPREDFELYHSLEANRSYGTAELLGDVLLLEGAAADALESQPGGSATLTLRTAEGGAGP